MSGSPLSSTRPNSSCWIWCLLAFSFVVVPHPATAGVILQDAGGWSLQLQAFEPLGQSFTAIDRHVSFAFWYLPMNPHFPNSDPVEVRLHEGTGVGGALVASSTFFLPNGFRGFYDVDFTSTPLIVGNVYTGVASILGSSPYWGLEGWGSLGDVYDGGEVVIAGIPRGSGDLMFRVTGTTIPIPSTFLLIIMGVAGIALRRRARSRSSQRLPDGL